jgi:hypothetical protein
VKNTQYKVKTYKTVTLSFILYGCDTWRRLHSEELRNLYASLDIVRVIKSRRISWAGHVTRMGEMRNVLNILFGKPEGKRWPGRTSRRWKDNIRINFRKMWWRRFGLYVSDTE